MPASDTFQQIGAQQPGPFSDYLRPQIERPIDQPMQGPTGWENRAAGAGQIALGFLKGIRANRVAQNLEAERNNQLALDQFQNHVNSLLRDPDLTDEGRRAIEQRGNEIMHQHMQYEMRDVPKTGVAGFFKNLLVNATGGPIKTREPINFNEATGELTNMAKGYSQKANFQGAIADATQAINTLRQQNENPTREQIEQAIAPHFQRVLTTAPSYMQAFGPALATGSYPAAGSVQDQMNQLNALPTAAPPATAPPPTAEGSTPAAGGPSVPPTQPPPGFVGPIQATEPLPVRPADNQVAAPMPAGIEYEPGFGPRRFAILGGIAGTRDGRVQISQPHLVQAGSRRIMGVNVMGSPNPTDNGYWDVQTGQKIKSPVSTVSVNAPHVVRKGPNDMAVYFDQNTGKEEYDLGPDGKPYKIPTGFIPVTDAQGNVRWMSKSDAQSGMMTGTQGLQNQREDRADTRASLNRQATRNGRFVTEMANYGRQKSAINTRFEEMIAAARRGQLNIVTSQAAGIGKSIDPKLLEQAKTNSEPLVQELERARQDRLRDLDASHAATVGAIDQQFPDMVGMPFSTQATTPPPATAPATQPPPGPASGGTGSIPVPQSSLRKKQ